MSAMRNPFAEHVDYEFLRDVIPSERGSILPSNIDGILERHGRFLVLEWKRPGEELGVGQKIMLQALAGTPCFTVVIVHGHSGTTGTSIESFHAMNKDGQTVQCGTGIDEFKDRYRAWFEK